MHRGREGSCSFLLGQLHSAGKGLAWPSLWEQAIPHRYCSFISPACCRLTPGTGKCPFLPHQLCVICVQTRAGAVSVTLSQSVLLSARAFSSSQGQTGIPLLIPRVGNNPKGLFPLWVVVGLCCLKWANLGNFHIVLAFCKLWLWVQGEGRCLGLLWLELHEYLISGVSSSQRSNLTSQDNIKTHPFSWNTSEVNLQV